MSPISRSHSSERGTRARRTGPIQLIWGSTRCVSKICPLKSYIRHITADARRMNKTNLLMKYLVTVVMRPRSVGYDLPDLEQ